MSLIRPFEFDYDVFDRMDSVLRQWENQLLPTQQQQQQQVGRRGGPLSFGLNYPPLDVLETKDSIQVHSELPGFKKENINISLHNNTLTISGEKNNEREEEKQEEGRQWKIKERQFGSFERRVVLPKTIDENNVQAKFENGVLQVTVPKKPEAVQQKKAITIQ